MSSPSSPFVVPHDRLDELMHEHNVSIHLGKDASSLHTFEIVVGLMYAILFLSGLVANIFVLVMITMVARHSASGYNNVMFYTVLLTCVDLFVLLTAPATIVDLASGHWLFPDSFCPFYWMIEMLNKIASSLIVSFIAIACYFGVCRPHMKSMYKSRTVAFMHLAVAMLDLSWKSYNVWRYSEVFYIVDIDEYETLDVYGKKCLFEPSESRDRAVFTVSAFLSGYLLPVAIMLTCYAAILRRVYVQSQSRLLSRRGMRQFQTVAKSASILIVFYLVTWSPYWFVTVFLSVTSPDDYGHVHESIGRVAYFFHLLPMANCAFSPLIYTLLNRHTREQYRSAVARNHHHSSVTPSQQNPNGEARTVATYV